MMDYDQTIASYRALREAKERINAETREKLAVINKRMAALEAELLKHMEAEGLQNVRTPHGTAYQTTRTSVRVADKDAFLTSVREADAWELLDVRASKTGVKAFLEENGALPPGVDLSEERVVNVRAS